MAIAYIASATATGGSGSDSAITVARPAGTASGHLLLAGIVSQGSAASCAGWTAIATTAPGGNLTLTTLYRVLGGSEPASYTFSTPSGQYNGGTIRAYSGGQVTAPVDVWATATATTSGTTITAPAVTTTGVGEMVVCFFAEHFGNAPTLGAGLGNASAALSVAGEVGMVSGDVAQAVPATVGPYTAADNFPDVSTGHTVALLLGMRTYAAALAWSAAAGYGAAGTVVGYGRALAWSRPPAWALAERLLAGRTLVPARAPAWALAERLSAGRTWAAATPAGWATATRLLRVAGLAPAVAVAGGVPGGRLLAFRSLAPAAGGGGLALARRLLAAGPLPWPLALALPLAGVLGHPGRLAWALAPAAPLGGRLLAFRALAPARAPAWALAERLFAGRALPLAGPAPALAPAARALAGGALPVFVGRAWLLVGAKSWQRAPVLAAVPLGFLLKQPHTAFPTLPGAAIAPALLLVVVKGPLLPPGGDEGPPTADGLLGVAAPMFAAY